MAWNWNWKWNWWAIGEFYIFDMLEIVLDCGIMRVSNGLGKFEWGRG
jgi:hypothetical protein